MNLPPVSVDRAAVLDWVHLLGHDVNPVPGHGLLLCLEGIVPHPGGMLADCANTQDVHNDTLIGVGPDAFGVWLGNLNSGSKLGRPSGFAQLCDGLHEYEHSLWKSDTRPCWRATPNGNRVARDLNKDGRLSLREYARTGHTYNRSVLLHPQWGNPRVGSAGCGGPKGNYESPAWIQMWALGPSLDVVVHEGKDFAAWLQANRPGGYKPFIRVGHNGLWTKRAQRLLGVAADGIWGPNTAAAVLEARARHGLDPDVPGIDFALWTALEAAA